MVQVFGSVWKRHIDQLLKTDAQHEHEGESDEAEISIEKRAVQLQQQRSHLKHHMNRKRRQTLELLLIEIYQLQTRRLKQVPKIRLQAMQNLLEDVIPLTSESRKKHRQ